MRPQVRMGLIVGGIGLVLNICASALFGFCGPFVALMGGAAAGFFAGQQEKMPQKAEGARVGAISGGIAGGLILVGQLIGGFASLFIAQSIGAEPLFGTIPSLSADPSELVPYYLGGFGTGICFGLAGLILAVIFGAAGGYLGTPSQPASPPAVG
jgi:hypothetical protein